MVEETQSSNRTLTIVLAAGALLLALVALAAVLIFVLGRGADEGVTAEAAKLMPPDTWLFFSMNPDFTAADNFDVIERAWGDVPGFDEVVDNWPAVLFEETDEVDYEADIAPWLGDELAFSIKGDLFSALGSSVDQTFAEIEGALSGETPPAPPPMPEVQIVIAVATKDTAASDEFLDKMRDEIEEDENLQETDYKGITVVYYEPASEGDMGAAYATVDDFIVLAAGGLETMQAVIDAKDGDNLADDETYKKVVEALPEGSLGFGYVNGGPLVEMLQDAMEDTSSMGMSELGLMGTMMDPAQASAVKGAGVALSLDPKGIRLDSVSFYDKEALPEAMVTTVNPNQAVQNVPADTLAYFSSADLGGVIEGVLDLVMAMPEMEAEDLEESLEMMEAQLGIKLDDLYEALSGEYSLALTYEAGGLAGDPSMPIGLLLQFENKDEATFKQLMSLVGMALMGQGGGMELETSTINDVSVTSAVGPNGETLVGWGLSEAFFAMGTSQGLLEMAFEGGDSLADDATFQAAMAPLPEETGGYFYLKVAGTLDIVYQALSSYEQEEFEEARDVLGPIKAISGASEPMSREKDSASATVFILLED
jgi:hypothetical protein